MKYLKILFAFNIGFLMATTNDELYDSREKTGYKSVVNRKRLTEAAALYLPYS